MEHINHEFNHEHANHKGNHGITRTTRMNPKTFKLMRNYLPQA